MARIGIIGRSIAYEIQIRYRRDSKSYRADSSEPVQSASRAEGHTVIIGRDLAYFLAILQTQIDRGVAICVDEDHS